jgi:serine/threonine protein kinase
MIDIGQQIDGYRLIKLIGKGGFSYVYKAEALDASNPHRVVAIKILHLDAPSIYLYQMRNEAMQAQKLNHPNIVKIYYFETTKTPHYLIMEYASQGSLRSYLEGKQLSLDIIVSYTKQISEALDYMHKKNLIHRDVKPENILLGDNNKILLSDLGIAIAPSNVQEQEINHSYQTGTLAYMAPELFQKQQASAKSDQYALGVMVYEWLCGQRPFNGSRAELQKKHINEHEPPPPLYVKGKDVSSYVEDVIRKALEKEPEKRYLSIRDFAYTLEKAYNFTKKSSAVTPYIPPEVNQESSAKIIRRPSSRWFEISRRTFLWAPALFLLGSWVTSLSKLSHSFSLSLSQGMTRLVYRGHTDNVNGIAWSPDGTRMASASFDGTVQVWDATTGNPLVTYIGHRDLTKAKDVVHVNDVAWSPDGNFIVSCSDKKKNQVHVWDATTREVIVEKAVWICSGHKDAVNAVAWSPKNDYLASASFDGTVRVWNWNSTIRQASLAFHYPPDLLPLKGRMFDVAWSSDAQYFAFCATSHDPNWWIVKTDDWKQQGDGWEQRLGFPIRGSFGTNPEDVLSISWSCNNQYIALGTGSSDGAIHVFDPRAQQEVQPPYMGHKTNVRRVAWSPECQDNSGLVASADTSGLIRLWRLGSKEQDAYPPFRDHQDYEVNALAWSPDGQKNASGGEDSLVRVWQAIDLLNQ